MSAGIIKRSVSIAGHRTSVSLEEPFWEALRQAADRSGVSVQSLIGRIDADRGEQNLSSAIRVFVLDAVRHAANGSDESSSQPAP
jgi:predicted DNA-binding ribbon-helix-helix protein